jgi:hypothetical protein
LQIRKITKSLRGRCTAISAAAAYLLLVFTIWLAGSCSLEAVDGLCKITLKLLSSTRTIHLQMIREYKADVARVGSKGTNGCWSIGRELAGDWTISHSSDGQVLLLAAVHLGLSDIAMGKRQDTHSIPAVIKGAVNPFPVSDTHRNLSTGFVGGEAIIIIRASSVCTV